MKRFLLVLLLLPITLLAFLWVIFSAGQFPLFLAVLRGGLGLLSLGGIAVGLLRAHGGLVCTGLALTALALLTYAVPTALPTITLPAFATPILPVSLFERHEALRGLSPAVLGLPLAAIGTGRLLNRRHVTWRSILGWNVACIGLSVLLSAILSSAIL